MAKKEMVEAESKISNFYREKYTNNRGLQFLDLIQEGNVGLMKALDDKLSIGEDINSPMQRGGYDKQLQDLIADQARTIRIPVHMIETINKIVRTQRKF